MHEVRRLYRSGHYFNGQGTSYGGHRLNNGYFNMKVHKKNVSTHRAIAWFWPRDGRRPVMPWMLQVDHVDNNYASIDYTQLRWVSVREHSRKHATKKKNNGNSKRVRGRPLGSESWTAFPSLMEGVRQTSCRQDGISNCANGTQRKTNATDGTLWEWEWCELTADRDDEAWRPCTLPGGVVVPHVQISNMGMILKNEALKTPGYLDGGYHKVNIGDASFLVHRLVASTWDRLPQEHEVCDHINGDKTDNRATNLRWVTTSVNNKNCLRPATNQSISTPVQPFFDAACTQAAHEPFASQRAAAACYGLKSGKSIGNALHDPSRTGGSCDGRKLYWRRVEQDYGPSAELDDAVAEHLEYLSGTRLDRRLRAEDAALGVPILQASSEGQVAFFEDLGGGTLRFYADATCLGEARCTNAHRLTARHVDGVWKIYELSD